MKKEKNGRSLYATLIMAFLACVFVILLFLMSVLILRTGELIRKNAMERTRETLSQSADMIVKYTDQLQNKMQFAVSLLPDTLLPADEWQSQLEFIKKSTPGITAIAVFSADGFPVYTTEGRLKPGTGAASAQAPWFQAAREQEGTITCFSEPHVQALFENQYAYVITLSRGVHYFKDGQPQIGVLMMDVDCSQFSALLKRIVLGTSGYAFIVDTQERMIGHPRLSEINLALYKEDLEPLKRKIIGLAPGVKEGRACFYMINTLNSTRWRLVGVAFTDELLQLQSSFFKLFAAALFSAALLAVGLTSFVAKQITKPLSNFEDVIKRVERGDLNATMHESGFREFRMTASAFNAMLLRVRILMNRIVEEQEKKRLYELNALQAQINPHFLYNTLDSIIWMEERGKSRESIAMVSALAKLFRISISKGRTEITVLEELNHVQNYLIIQKMRFKEKFVYEIEADEGVHSLETIKLIVQPLVENSLNHAIDETFDKQLRISVKAFQEQEILYFTVEDDGIGIPESKLKNLLDSPGSDSGIGIHNVHERIQLTYGKEYGLTIESHEDEGTLVTIRLPAHKGEKV